jgi:chromosome segregation ATPase
MKQEISKRGTAVLSKRTDSLVHELVETETQITQQALELLRSQYRKEKDNWAGLYENQVKEAESLRLKLHDAEQRLKRLQDEYIQIEVEEMEKLKLSAEESKAKRQAEQGKWDFIEEQIKVYIQIVNDTQKRLMEGEKDLIRLREEFAEKETALHNTIRERESELLKLKEEAELKEQTWLKDRSKYEEDIEQLRQQLEHTEGSLQDDRKNQLEVTEKKDGELHKLQQALREVTVQFTEEGHRVEMLKERVVHKDERIGELEKTNEKILIQLEQERKKWQEVFKNEKTKWEEYESETSEKKKLLKQHTEEQVNHVMNMLAAVEIQLKKERENRQDLEKQIKAIHIEKRLLEKQHEKLKQEIMRLQNKTSELRAGINEEKKIIQLEKGKKQELKLKLEQLEQESAGWKKNLLREQLHYENRIKELTSQKENIQKSREDEIGNLEQETVVLNGELAEIRSIYHVRRIENEQNKSRIQELEIALGKQIDLYEKERSEWENLLFNEEERSESRKKAILNRENKLREERENEVKRLEAALNESEQSVQAKDKELIQIKQEISRLQEENTKLK